MKVVSFYHKESGILHPVQLVASDDAVVELNTPPDHIVVEGHYDRTKHKVNVVTGVLEPHAMEPDPAHPHDRRRGVEQTFNALELQSLRALREAVLGQPGARDRLAALEGRMQSLRRELDGL